MSDLISLSSSKWFFLEMTLTLAPVAFSHSAMRGIERLILLAADQFGVDGDALELARAGPAPNAAPAPSANTITPADTPESSLFIRSSLGRGRAASKRESAHE